MPEWVSVCHVDLPETEDAPGLVTKESFELMKENGWRLHKPSHQETNSKEK